MSYYEGKETASSWWRHGVSLLSGADKKFALSLYLRPISLSLRLRQSLPASSPTSVQRDESSPALGRDRLSLGLYSIFSVRS